MKQIVILRLNTSKYFFFAFLHAKYSLLSLWITFGKPLQAPEGWL